MKRLLVIFVMLIFVNVSFSQNKGPKFSAGVLVNQYLGYNFFLGNNAKEFVTSPKAFGSGLYDFSAVYTPYTYWISKPIKRNIGLLTTIGFELTKYRFENNLIFDEINSTIDIDTLSTHFYDPDFFSTQGTKLVMGKLYIPLFVYLPVSHWFKNGNEDFGIFGGIVYKTFLFAYHKQSYTQNNRDIVFTTPNLVISKYFVKNDFAVKAGLKIKGIIIFGQYTLNSFFNSNLPYDIHEARVGLNFSFDFSSGLKKIEENNLFGQDLGTDAR